ncbi:LacI family transcriptional regulator [Bifidobacterium actinocoloniiforme DSM 22766]|uniref:LacI family transcriptional regulator n=1 Tax=Bifidobacterium actinocoloniiforme DSM 22766 TaxID=1437605 RepID=A0A086YWC4_9BIFI|nr:LacI family DNA-binding transcriptional regulator [Bifidobacterium actinocoloniiforme]AKV55779.1 LacI family transcriptional regulator [Bifidobacterium actinocoloniiforme DSM 22766]KFI38574.1 LacI family transcriptional regulator [Bifidobacterium actinocoloniiforme DSM 22766]
MTAQTGARQPRPKRATRTDVARLAEVSTAVVSYVFNNGPRHVAPETAEKVRKAAQMLNYHPNTTARALRTGFSKMMGVVVPDSSNPYSAGVYDELQTAAMARGYSLVYMNVRSDTGMEDNAIGKLVERNMDAIFMSSTRDYSQLTGAHLNQSRFVFMDQPRPVPGAKCVSTNFYDSAYQAVGHLIEHGHRRIDMLFGGSPKDSTDMRIQGWYEAHLDANLRAGTVMQSFYSREGGYQATLALLDEPEPPTAIFAASDLEAMGALRALHERGLRIPQDVAIVSFDGTVDSLYTWPQLTTMQQNTRGIAERAMRAALYPDSTPDVQLVDAELVIRQSCGC